MGTVQEEMREEELLLLWNRHNQQVGGLEFVANRGKEKNWAIKGGVVLEWNSLREEEEMLGEKGIQDGENFHSSSFPLMKVSRKETGSRTFQKSKGKLTRT